MIDYYWHCFSEAYTGRMRPLALHIEDGIKQAAPATPRPAPHTHDLALPETGTRLAQLFEGNPRDAALLDSDDTLFPERKIRFLLRNLEALGAVLTPREIESQFRSVIDIARENKSRRSARHLAYGLDLLIEKFGGSSPLIEDACGLIADHRELLPVLSFVSQRQMPSALLDHCRKAAPAGEPIPGIEPLRQCEYGLRECPDAEMRHLRCFGDRADPHYGRCTLIRNHGRIVGSVKWNDLASLVALQTVRTDDEDPRFPLVAGGLYALEDEVSREARRDDGTPFRILDVPALHVIPLRLLGTHRHSRETPEACLSQIEKARPLFASLAG